LGSFASVFVCPWHVRCWGAGSTGRRNTGVKSLCWGFKLQGLTWPFVWLTSHFVQIGLRMRRQVGALREVLSQQAIGVLVRPALPRALRIAINHSLTMCLQAQNHLGSFILGRRANARGGLDGANGMSGREMQADANLLSAIAMMIVGALGAGLPMALVIIWLCA
jgi:hypothetical protein